MALSSFNAPNIPLFESMGGCIRFTFKDVAGVTSIPAAVEQNVADNIVITGDWFEGYATLERLRFTEKEDTTEDGILYKTSLKGFVPGDRPDNAELFRKLKYARLIVVGKDNNGKQRIIGELGNGAKFTYQYDSEGKIAGLPGYEYEFTWESSRPAYHYQGVVPPPGTVVNCILEIPTYDCSTLNNELTMGQRAAILRVPLGKTGQTTSYAAGDDGDLEKGKGTTFLTLGCNNPFGNTNRFTNSLGGQVTDGTDGSIADYRIDHLTGLGWYTVIQGPVTWNDALNACNGSNAAGFGDWRLPNKLEILTPFEEAGISAMNNSLLIDILPNIYWASTTKGGSTANAYYLNASSHANYGELNKTNKANNAHYLMCRNHY